MSHYRYLLITIAALSSALPSRAIAQSSEREIERLAESIASRAERVAAQVERQATRFADRFEREWNRRERDHLRRERDQARRRTRSGEFEQAWSLDTTFAFSPDGTIDLRNVAGDIVVTGWDRREARIQAQGERGDVDYAFSSSRITIEERVERGRWRRDDRGRETRFELSVPRGVRIIARSTSGDVTLRGTGGEVEAHSLSGDVDVEDAVRRIELESVSGDVTAKQLRGDVKATSVSGSVELSDVEGNVQIESTSGDIGLAGVRSRQVDASTTSGEIVFGGELSNDGHYEFHSHSGNIELSVPASSSARFSVETYSGDLGSDFPITLQPGQRAGGRQRRMEFTVGSGAARIVAETFSGNLDIRKR